MLNRTGALGKSFQCDGEGPPSPPEVRHNVNFVQESMTLNHVMRRIARESGRMDPLYVPRLCLTPLLVMHRRKPCLSSAPVR